VFLEPEGDKPLLAGISQSIFSLELEFSVCSTVGWCSLCVWSAAVFLTLIFLWLHQVIGGVGGFFLILWDTFHFSPKRECMVQDLRLLLLLQLRSSIFGEVVHCRLVGYRCLGTICWSQNTCYQLPTFAAQHPGRVKMLTLYEKWWIVGISVKWQFCPLQCLEAFCVL